MRYVYTFCGIVFLVAAMALFYLHVYSANGSSSSHAFFAPEQPALVTATPLAPAARNLAVAIVSMLAGIGFGAVYARLAAAKEGDNAWKLIPEALSSPQLLRSLIASPIVFAGVYSASQTQPDLIVSALFAFQNGFFCDAVLRKRESS